MVMITNRIPVIIVVVFLVTAIACSCQETGEKSDVVSRQIPAIVTCGGPVAVGAWIWNIVNFNCHWS